MEITGKITAVSPLQSGVSQNGEWKSLDFVIEEVDKQYPESLVCKARGELAEKIAAASGLVGSTAKAYIGFKARTYTKDGIRHSITDITCWKLESNDDLPF